MSALGSENGNDNTLIYTWSATSVPAGVTTPTFSINGTNAAKTTTAKFYGAGSYTFLVTIADADQVTITSSVNVVVHQTLTSLTIAPTNITLPIDSTQQFGVQAFDQFGATISAPVTWSRSSGSVGSISGGGLFSTGTSSGSATIRATSGAATASAAVKVIAAGISGTVFDDVNGDGLKSASEKGISGRTVYLEIAGQGTKGEHSTTTNSSGVFSFANLVAGKYVLVIPAPAGWRSTTALAAGDPLTLAAGANVGGLLFGQTQLALVSGSVYIDSNDDGKKENDETSLAGWTVQLLSTTNSAMKFTAVTGSSGEYSFGAIAGSYVLSVIPKPGFKPTSPAGGSYGLKLTAAVP